MKKTFYSVAVVSKYDIVKLFVCSFSDWESLSNKIESEFTKNIFASFGDYAECKFKISKEAIHERAWSLAGILNTREKCYSKGKSSLLTQTFEVHVIKSAHSPHPDLPHISLWCGTCVQRPRASKILHPRMEAFLISEPQSNRQHYPQEKNNKSFTQKIGITKYKVKLIYIGSQLFKEKRCQL